jgi:hypothetical protein
MGEVTGEADRMGDGGCGVRLRPWPNVLTALIRAYCCAAVTFYITLLDMHLRTLGYNVCVYARMLLLYIT